VILANDGYSKCPHTYFKFFVADSVCPLPDRANFSQKQRDFRDCVCSSRTKRLSADTFHDFLVGKLTEQDAPGRRTIRGKMRADADTGGNDMLRLSARNKKGCVVVEYGQGYRFGQFVARPGKDWLSEPGNLVSLRYCAAQTPESGEGTKFPTGVIDIAKPREGNQTSSRSGAGSSRRARGVGDA
jgi:hypothetical protein